MLFHVCATANTKTKVWDRDVSNLSIGEKHKPQHQQSLISLQAGLDRPLLQTFETIQKFTFDIAKARTDAVPRFQTQIPSGRSSTPSTDYVQYI